MSIQLQSVTSAATARVYTTSLESESYDSLRAIGRGDWQTVGNRSLETLCDLGLIAPFKEGWRVTLAGMARLRSVGSPSSDFLLVRSQ